MKKIAIYTLCIAGLLSCKKDPVQQSARLHVELVKSNTSIVKVSQTTTTRDIVVLEYTITAKGGDVNLYALPVELKSSTKIRDVVSHATIRIGNRISNAIVSAQGIISFDDIQMTLYRDEPRRITVMIDVRPGQQYYVNNTTVKASLLVHDIDAEDLATSVRLRPIHLIGDVTGNTLKLIFSGIVVTYLSSDTLKLTNPTGGRYSMKVAITAFGSDFFMAKTAGYGINVSNTTAVRFVLEKSTASDVAVANVTSVSTISSTDATVAGQNVYIIPDGMTITVSLVAEVSGVPSSGLYNLRMSFIRVFTNQYLTSDAITIELLPYVSFRTSSIVFT